MSRYTVIIDANVLYHSYIRWALLNLAGADLFTAKWTEEIHREWMRNLAANRPDLDKDKIRRVREVADAMVPDCLIAGYEELIPSLNLPDGKDRHVLAAAIVGGCDAIVTENIRDFPQDEIGKYGIEAQHPDQFFCNLLSLTPGEMCEVLRMVRLGLKKPPRTAEEYLDILSNEGLVGFAREIRDQKFITML